MKKIILTCALAIILSACSPVDSMRPFDNQQAANLLKQHLNVVPTKQMIALNLPNKHHWQRFDVSYGTVGTPIMLIPTTENPQNWTESFRTRISDDNTHPGVTPLQFAQQQINDAKAHCVYANGDIVQENKEYAIYQLNMSDCQEEKNLMQIGKAIKGIDAVYLVDYSATANISKSHFEQMARAVRSATLVSNVKRKPH